MLIKRIKKSDMYNILNIEYIIVSMRGLMVEKKNRFENIYLRYTLSFVVLALITFLPFLTEGKSFVWETDGISQHYPILYYYGNLLKEILSGQGFPMVDFRIGLGFDTISTTHYYALGDPIALLSVFMTSKNAVFIYGMLVILRLYLAGISFILFAGIWRKKDLPVLLGALIYVFCGYSFYAGVRHPFFLNPMIYLPLLLLGIERIMQKKKPVLFIMITFTAAISNFYFFYMLTIVAVFYFIIRYIFVYQKSHQKVFKGFLLTGLRTAGYYLVGLGMAAFIFLPVVYAFMQNGRSESKPQLLIGFLHYQKGYYYKLLQGLFATGISPGYWVNLTFSTVIAVSLAIAMTYKKYRQLRAVIVAAFLGLSIPLFGYAMNGFSYITNRWSFSISILAAILFTITYDELFVKNKRLNLLLSLGVLGYGIIAFYNNSNKLVKYEFFLLAATIMIILLLQSDRFIEKKSLKTFVLTALVFITLGFHGYAYYSPGFYGYVDEFLTREEVEEQTRAGVLTMIDAIEDDSFYRIETFGDKSRNEALCKDFYDVSGYFSVMDGNITDYYKQLELLNQRNAYRFDNHDNRTVLNALANVKYFVTTHKSTAPYAYELIDKKEGPDKYYLYKNLFWVPFGYTYDHYILENEYDKLSALEKQSTLLKAVVLENELDNIPKIAQDFDRGIEGLRADIIPDENIELKDGLIKVKKAGATITLNTQSKPKSEVYVRLKGFNIEKRASTMATLKVRAEKEAAKNVNVRSRYHNTYFREDYLINTGYSKNSKSFITIEFLQKGTYSCDSIEVYNVEMDYYKTAIKELGRFALSNIKQSNNLIQGDITLDRDKMMVFSIPYSKGWKAYVNNQRVEVLRANTMNTAIALEEGENHITLRYRTPFLMPGMIISAAALLVFTIILIDIKRKPEPSDF